ncbi:unnamed protein product [Closterium sp. NIES-64]|nr:unnamed protein product [Closterium sp. NIES-64]
MLINTVNTANATVNAPYTLLVPLEALDYCTTIKKYPSQQLLPLMAYHIVKGRFTYSVMNASSPGGRRTGGSCAVLASELPRGEEDRWVLCGAGQRAPQGGRRTGGSCAVLASELPRGEEDRWALCGAGQRAPQGGGGPVGPFLACGPFVG